MGTTQYYIMCVPYGGNLWWGETSANLANDHKFAKVSPANFSHSYSFVINFLKFNDTTPSFVKLYSLNYKRSFAAISYSVYVSKASGHIAT